MTAYLIYCSWIWYFKDRNKETLTLARNFYVKRGNNSSGPSSFTVTATFQRNLTCLMSVPNIKSNFTCHEARLFENIKGYILYNTFLRYVHNKLHYKFYPILQMEFIDDLPKTGTGKVDRRKLQCADLWKTIQGKIAAALSEIAA